MYREDSTIMRRILIFVLLTGASASASTVQTQVACGIRSNPQGGFVTSSGSYGAACVTSYIDYPPSLLRYASASAHVDAVNFLVETSAGGNPNIEVADAAAYFSAQYMLTLTAGNNLWTDDPQGPYAMVSPCFVVSGRYEEYSYTFGMGHNSAELSGGLSGRQYGTGSTCGPTSYSNQRIYANVPITVRLDLSAASVAGPVEFTSAALTGFKFFGTSWAPLEGAAYTFMLNDVLPPTPLPEPGTVFPMAVAVGMFLLVGLVRRGKAHP
jgi:hypothetical protein